MVKTSQFNSASVAEPNPNPQGKGLVPILAQLNAGRMISAEPKNAAQCLLDYLVSAIVLSASFGFQPVVGREYFLYWRDEWQLSLIGPDQWGDGITRVFIGTCLMRPDYTWQLDAAADLVDYPEVVAALAEFEGQFKQELNTSDPLLETLPFYRASLPFWRRILAHALASSLATSLHGSGIAEISARQLLGSESLTTKLIGRSESGTR